MPKLGDVIDIKLGHDDQPLYIVGTIIGIREGWRDRDQIAVQIRHLDWWIDLDEKASWEVIQ